MSVMKANQHISQKSISFTCHNDTYCRSFMLQSIV